MGGRGAFKNIEKMNFVFVEGGQTYHIVGEVDNVRVLVRDNPYSVKAPEYSHTANRIYAIIQNGELKHLAFYDENHAQKRVIDFKHKHGLNGVVPHVHFEMKHNKNELGTPPSKEDSIIANKIQKWLKRR